MINNSLIDYILDYLIGAVYLDDVASVDESSSHEPTVIKRSRRLKLIRYTRDPEKMKGADVVIYPSTFFDLDVYGTERAFPSLPLEEWEGIPLLYGTPRHEWSSDGYTLIIYADVVASTYFLISRYEEMWRRNERDEQGRFPGKASLPYRAGFLHRPIVDEYGLALRRIITDSGILDRAGAKLSPRGAMLSRVNMTYDVEHLFRYRGLGGFGRAIADGLPLPIGWTYLLGRHQGDPYYETILKIISHKSKVQDAQLKPALEMSLFLGVGRSKSILRRMRNKLPSRLLRIILSKADRVGMSYGLLFGLDASSDTRCLPAEKEALQSKLERVTIHSRHQALALREPEDMLDLLSIGIRHDYSMSYTDVPGYRLGTCRAVRFINPNTRALTDLVMHPVLYPMAGYQETEQVEEYETLWHSIEALIKASVQYSGELNVLWRANRLTPELSPTNARLHQDVLQLLYHLSSKQGDTDVSLGIHQAE